MSPARDDASQGTFFEVYENLLLRYFLHNKKTRLAAGLILSYLHYYSIILLTVNIGPQFLAAVTQIPFLEVDA